MGVINESTKSEPAAAPETTGQPGLLIQLKRGEWSQKPKSIHALLTVDRADGERVAWLPRGTVALLASPGGTGKSTLTMQLVLAVASGTPWLSKYEVVEPGRVFVWSGEDEEEDMHRRVHSVASVIPGGLAGLPEGWEDNIYRCATNGEDSRFVDVGDKTLAETLFFQSILDQVELFQPALVVLDPASRFMGTDENDNAQATRWITLVEKLKNAESKPTVLVLLHTKKGGVMSSQEAIRGASALVDGARWAATVERLTADGDGYDALRLRRVKNNRCPKDDGGMMLVRNKSGAMAHATQEEQEAITYFLSAKKADANGGNIPREPAKMAPAPDPEAAAKKHAESRAAAALKMSSRLKTEAGERLQRTMNAWRESGREMPEGVPTMKEDDCIEYIIKEYSLKRAQAKNLLKEVAAAGGVGVEDGSVRFIGGAGKALAAEYKANLEAIENG